MINLDYEESNIKSPFKPSTRHSLVNSNFEKSDKNHISLHEVLHEVFNI